MSTCKECGTELTQEMIDVNMCWECGAILDESQADEITLMITNNQYSDSELGELYEKQSKIQEKEAEQYYKESIKRAEEEKIKARNDEIEKVKQINDMYEYKSVVVNDKLNGETNMTAVNETLTEYAKMGWRLISIFTNEVGKNALHLGVNSLAGGINSTSDQVVMIFERCIYRWNKSE